MGTSGAVELELERRETLEGGGLSSTSQLGTHWLIFWGELKELRQSNGWNCAFVCVCVFAICLFTRREEK